KLGFFEVKSRIEEMCLSVIGQEMVDKIQPMHQFAQVEKFLRQTHEFKNILLNDVPLPITHLYHIRNLVEKVRVEGSFLSEEEFFQITLTLIMVFAVIHYFNERKGQYEALEALFENLTIVQAIL